MEMKFFYILLVLLPGCICGTRVETLRYCCELGTNHANSNAQCEPFESPIAGVDKNDELSCQDSIRECCTNRLKEIAKKTTPASDSLLPSLGNLCEIGTVCAQICIPTADSFICDCHPGFTLMADKISCKPIKKQPSEAGQRINRCEQNNPCEHNCTDTGVAIECSCALGFTLGKDKKSCKDVDECFLGTHDCLEEEICVNGPGYYDCELFEEEEDGVYDTPCPPGYAFNGTRQTCDDIDECKISLICDHSETCVNTLGSFTCTPGKIECPPGFTFQAATQDCEDVDECVTGQNDCNQESQVCLNTKGNFTCIDKASKTLCPAGFKMNQNTATCEDINECIENPDLCGPGLMCVNEPGGHNCVDQPVQKPPLPAIYPTSKVTTKSTPPTMRTATTKKTTTTTRRPTTTTKPTKITTTISITSTTKKTTPITTTTKKMKPSLSTPLTTIYRVTVPKPSCPSGYTQNSLGQCIDIDECREGRHMCDQYQDCQNTPGDYICNCKIGFRKDVTTGACVDINECQMLMDDCGEGQRCDNTIGSYFCARIAGCGTGYTLNYGSGLCEDDDECALGTHSCDKLGSDFECINTKGSYRCRRLLRTFPTSGWINIPLRNNSQRPNFRETKRCLPGYYMNQFGQCIDINECESNPCWKGQKCINLNGRYECISNIECKGGYELNEAGDKCVDINECARGTHSCSNTQICKNAPGYHICKCPSGHKLVQSECVDINECDFYKGRGICSINSECINTIGSYKCRCKDGFREQGNSCADIDECTEQTGLCEQICVNLWGSYRCSCKAGFTLNADNRTCTDVNECERFKDKHLCVGSCENTPGSYECTCPPGYKVGTDDRTCQDIDECAIQNPCRNPNEICYNIRGSFACPTITCPNGYIRDPDHKSRCKRSGGNCEHLGDSRCLNEPQQYSFHFISFVSRMPLFSGGMDFFQMRGPSFPRSRATFNLKLENVKCPSHVERANLRFFKLIRDDHRAIVSVVKPIEGPQEIEMSLEMQLYASEIFRGKVVTKLFIFVTEHPF